MPNGPDNYFRQKAAQQKSSTLRDNYNAKADQMDELQFNGAQGDHTPPAPAAPDIHHADSVMYNDYQDDDSGSAQSVHKVISAESEPQLYRPQHLRADKHKSNIR